MLYTSTVTDSPSYSFQNMMCLLSWSPPHPTVCMAFPELQGKTTNVTCGKHFTIKVIQGFSIIDSQKNVYHRSVVL